MSHGIFYLILLRSDLISEPASESLLETLVIPSSSRFVVVEEADVVVVVVVLVVDVDVVVFGILFFDPQAAKNNEIAIVDMIIGIYIFFIFITPFYHFFHTEAINTRSD